MQESLEGVKMQNKGKIETKWKKMKFIVHMRGISVIPHNPLEAYYEDQ